MHCSRSKRNELIERRLDRIRIGGEAPPEATAGGRSASEKERDRRIQVPVEQFRICSKLVQQKGSRVTPEGVVEVRAPAETLRSHQPTTDRPRKDGHRALDLKSAW